MIYRSKHTFEAFLYNGQYTTNCPEWARECINEYKRSLIGYYLMKNIVGEVIWFPKEAFEILYEPVEQKIIHHPEGIEDPNEVA